jgi:hypothetical protein
LCPPFSFNLAFVIASCMPKVKMLILQEREPHQVLQK